MSVPSAPAPAVSPARLMETVRHLSTVWPTRNTSTTNLVEAAEWVAGQYRGIPGLAVEIMRYRVEKGPRVPEAKDVVQVIATLRGETDHRVLVGGHLDSYNKAGDPLTAPAPGANDDASGVALALECARILASQGKPRNTLVFVAFSGEEQGLFGSGALAQRAKDEGWTLDAVLSNDTVGGGAGAEGQSAKDHVRLYSEETDTHPSRELARFLEWTARGKVRGFGAKLVFRRDRFQRGGDHTPFNKLGFPAVRFVESVEDLSRQHTPRDTVEGVDARYLANVTRLNLLGLQALAAAGAAPTEVKYDPKQAYSTMLRWKGAGDFTVYWRETASAVWQGSRGVSGTGPEIEATIEGVNKDDHTFAVGAVGGVPVPVETIR